MISHLLHCAKQAAIAIDQFINCFFYHRAEGFGMADETLSARAWRLRSDSRFWSLFYRIIDRLFFWQKHHCKHAYLAEKNRYQLPPELRENGDKV